ncbi:endonuclease I family protein [Saccharopolyspora cebuensis]|uniref:Endonuclease I family protein n=1 Tax=Saccharopolyspora cebuensis TaxID=418759 RepID=A0ABV4CFV0_9PSEU
MPINRWKPLPLLIGAALAAGAPPVAVAEPAPGTAAVADYYQDAEGKTGEELKTALHRIISTGTTTLTYDEVWDALKVTDQHPADAASITLLYSGEPRSKDSNGGGADEWNREHVWPKSHGDFGTAPGPGTDVHHLRPTDVTVNSERGNKDFDLGGSEVGEAPGNRTDADSWEPRDEVKGDVARMVFYMAVRYEGADGFADLELNDQVDNGSAPYLGRSSVLREWHRQDPPDAAEQRRNDVIYERFQHNRNPFVDRPEWVGAIWG